MEYNLQLPRRIQGTELMEALKKTSCKLRWSYEQQTEELSVRPGCVEIEPSSFSVKIDPRIFRSLLFGDELSIYSVVPLQEYSELTLDGSITEKI